MAIHSESVVYPFGDYHQPGRQRELHHRWHCGRGFGALQAQTKSRAVTEA